MELAVGMPPASWQASQAQQMEPLEQGRGELRSQVLELVRESAGAGNDGNDGGAAVAGCLVHCAAFAKELETQSHLIHANYEGANFLSVHAFLKDQYERHLAEFDALAEFVRAMDFLLPMCSCGLKEAACGFENVDEYDGRHMLLVYLRNLEQQACLALGLEEAAGQARAVDVQNYAAELVAASKKAAWFLKATLRGC